MAKTGAEQQAVKEVTAPKRPTYTIDRGEMLEEVGITDKILRTWVNQGLFEAQQGKRTRRFTQQDVAKLQFVKNLRQDLGLSVETTRRLLRRFSDVSQFPSEPLKSYPFLHLSQVKLLNTSEALWEILEDEMNKGSKQRTLIETWLLQVAAQAFGTLTDLHLRDPIIHQAARNKLIGEIRRMELGSRLNWNWEETDESKRIYRFSPPFPDDPDPNELSPMERRELVEANEARIVYAIF